MAEIQTHTNAGEMTQQFIEFVMMQSQNAALFLGQMPNPQTGEAEVNLDVARMFIDQLVMIREKTRGNLTGDEQKVLNNAIGGLQMAFVEVSKEGAPSAAADRSQPAADMEPEAGLSSREVSGPDQVSPAASPQETAAPDVPADDTGSKKRFTKSYG